MDQIDGQQFKKILGYVKSGVDSGATLVTGGDRLGDRGFYIQPTVFADVQVRNVCQMHRIYRQLADKTVCPRLVVVG